MFDKKTLPKTRNYGLRITNVYTHYLHAQYTIYSSSVYS